MSPCADDVPKKRVIHHQSKGDTTMQTYPVTRILLLAIAVACAPIMSLASSPKYYDDGLTVSHLAETLLVDEIMQA